MIQRIQSLFLLAAAACFGIACFMPIGAFNVGEMYVYSPWTLSSGGEFVQETYYIGLLMVILAVMSFVAVFFYKNRPLQSKICMAAILIGVVLLLLMVYVYPDVVFAKRYRTVEVQYYGHGEFPWVFLPFVSLVCLYLANRFILRDEKKVRAADRLR
jgi:uncharacterized membrane protein